MRPSSVGADESKGRTAATGFSPFEQLAARTDITADLAVLETRLTWHLGGLGALIIAVVAVLSCRPA